MHESSIKYLGIIIDSILNWKSQVSYILKKIKRNTVFIRLSARGAYLIFGLSGWALIRGGRLFEVGRLLNFHHFQ